jgi:opacity protein-like surface antigen
MARHIAMAALTGMITLTSLGTAHAQAPGNWTGAYLGGFAGSSFSATPGSSTSFIGGGLLGWNVQARAAVLGIEGDLAEMANSHWGWESSVRGRLGFLMNYATLVYATGGAVWARVHGDGIGANSTAKSGYTVGAGSESAALFRGVKARLEYRYTDLGTLDGCATGTTVVATTAGCNSRASFQSVTVGLAIPLGALAQPVRRVAR